MKRKKGDLEQREGEGRGYKRNCKVNKGNYVTTLFLRELSIFIRRIGGLLWALKEILTFMFWAFGFLKGRDYEFFQI